MGVVWAVLAVSVIAGALEYDSRPGEPPLRLPDATVAGPGLWSLILMIHPDCPCTKATMRNLSTILESTRIPIKAEIVAAMPEGYKGPRANLAIARSIVKSDLVVMSESSASERFGARTSGHLFVFDPDRNLVYSGGLTPARGAEDASSSLKWFQALVTQYPVASSGPTFGCPLAARRRGVTH